jgi:hypothetical protein
VGGRVKSAATSAGASGSIAAELHERLQARKGEIEQAIITRVYAISDPSGVSDPGYAEGLRAAVGAAIDYGLEGIQSSERNPPLIPPALLVQARIAARSGVGLDTVLRRYFAGYALLGDFLIEEARERMQGEALKRLLRLQASLFDRVLAAVSEEHRRDGQSRPDTSERRRYEVVQRLLDGELLDATELAYDLEAIHLGVVAQGPDAADSIRTLAQALDRRLLLVCPDEQTTWGWLAGRRPFDPEEVRTTIGAAPSPRASLALGEPGEGLSGWRFSHRQACAALQIAVRAGERVIRYADVALLASILQDDLLVASLRQLYLEPLEQERDEGEAAKATLRAYFASGRNVSSAAAALGVNRNTVTNRIRAAEEAVGRPLDTWASEFEAALMLEELKSPQIGGDIAHCSTATPLFEQGGQAPRAPLGDAHQRSLSGNQHDGGEDAGGNRH